MKKNLLLTAFLILSLAVSAQTNVSGGIYTHTTWAKINSPYIVTDTIVVFPDVILTIEPGVVVKFADNKRLEIRYARLIAEGTSTDSITFTSNSGSPHPGSWGEIWLNHDTSSRFNYCNFSYANSAVDLNNAQNIICKNSAFNYNNFGWGNQYEGGYHTLIDNCSFIHNAKVGVAGLHDGTVTNCNFSLNKTGIDDDYGYGNKYINCIINKDTIGINRLSEAEVSNCIIKSCLSGIICGGDATIRYCIIDSNTVVGIRASSSDTIRNCVITNNGTGLRLSSRNVVSQNIIENNSTGILVEYTNNSVYCNNICNNSLYNLYYDIAFGSNSAFSNNYWCTTDSVVVAGTIYDGYDNINLSLAHFTPLDTTQCYSNTCSAYFFVYPNSSVPHTYYAVNRASGLGPLTYIWSWGDGTSDTAAYPSHTYASAGFYTICLSITDSTGCTNSYCNGSNLLRNTNAMIYVNVVSEITTDVSESAISNAQFAIFPNPATNTVTISIDESMIGSTATLTDITGRKLTAVQLQTPNTKLETASIANGVYFVTVANGRQSATRKLVVSK